MIGGLALIPQIVDRVRLPVVAAGGIMDGRGIAAALALGAQGAQLGTAGRGRPHGCAARGGVFPGLFAVGARGLPEQVAQPGPVVVVPCHRSGTGR
jgi:hypothetical protein